MPPFRQKRAKNTQLVLEVFPVITLTAIRLLFTLIGTAGRDGDLYQNIVCVSLCVHFNLQGNPLSGAELTYANAILVEPAAYGKRPTDLFRSLVPELLVSGEVDREL